MFFDEADADWFFGREALTARLVTAGSDQTVKVWEVAPTQNRNDQPLTLAGYGTSIYRVVFSPDGKRLATAGASNEASRVYALPVEDIIAIAKSRVTRALTTDECQKFLHTAQCPGE